MMTLHEIAMQYATKQPGMIDSILEETTILPIMKWIPATHGTWNVVEKLTDVQGPSWTKLDGPLPMMSMSKDLIHKELNAMGGYMEVPTTRALKFGGAMSYFAQKQDALLRKAGQDVEKAVVEDVWLGGALSVPTNVYSAGAPQGPCYYILAVKMDDLKNVGLYDPDQFDSGRFLQIDYPYGGAEHILHSKENAGVLGYSVVYRGIFGWQMIEPKKTVAAIVNIDKDNAPTADQIDDMLAQIDATPGNTFLIMPPRGRIYGINPNKTNILQMTMSEKDINVQVESWSGIPILISHNIKKTHPHVAANRAQGGN